MPASRLSDEVRAALGRWPAKARALFDELLEDAASELQREFLHRAVAAGHTPAEVHAFADELRALSDDEAYEACTVDADPPPGASITQLLRAEADPLFAFELRGHALAPADEKPAPLAAMVDDGRGLARRRVAFEAESAGPRVAPKSTARAEPSAAPASGEALFRDLLDEATRAFRLTWREHDVDAPGGLTMQQTLDGAAKAVGRGVPVLVALGPAPRTHHRLAMVLQVSTSGRTRAWQLYDPLSNELVWTNEGDLLAGRELPFANKANRRLTRVALPTSR
jgi:hypothetical protein